MHPKPGGVNTERVYDSSRDYTEYTEVPANNMAWLLRGRNLQKYFKAIL